MASAAKRHRGVEAETAGRAPDVVVDGLGHADHRDAHQVELMRDLQRAVAADDDQRVQLHLREGLDHAFGVVGMAPPVGDGIFERVAAIGRAEDGAAQPQDAGDVPGRQQPRARRVEQSVKAVLEPDDLDSGVERRLDHRTNDRVEAGRVAAAGQDSDSRDRGHVPANISDLCVIDRRYAVSGGNAETGDVGWAQLHRIALSCGTLRVLQTPEALPALA